MGRFRHHRTALHRHQSQLVARADDMHPLQREAYAINYLFGAEFLISEAEGQRDSAAGRHDDGNADADRAVSGVHRLVDSTEIVVGPHQE